jgi:dUTP pyrophosphatase
MIVKIKKTRKSAIIPKYAKPGDAGLDLTAADRKVEGIWNTYYTGLAVEIPSGYVGLLFPRSSVYKTEQRLANSVGVIDSGYRGEIMMKFNRSIKEYKIGDRIGQLIIIPYPQIEFEEVNHLSDTHRGGGGFGSTGS